RYPRSHSKPKRRRSTRTIPILVRRARTLLQQQRMTVASRNLQVITGRAAREGGRERVCFAQKHRRDEKMAMWATQQPHRDGTTSCASRPSAGIDRAKCLISLKATGE